MKKIAICLVLITSLVWNCTQKEQNPFFSEYQTPFQTPPFEQIKEAHFLPAFQEGMRQQQAEVEAIVNNSESPTFTNTVETLEHSGELLQKVSNVFFNLNSANTNDEIQRISKEVTPLLSKHQDDIFLNEELYQRVKTVYQNRENSGLDKEQQKLLEEYYKDFVKGGADLPEDKKAEFREINQELALLTVQFAENVLKEDNNFELVIEQQKDLAGLPETVITTASETARERGKEGKWVFTLHKPSLIPFLQNSEKRELREKIFKAYIERGNNGNQYDNKQICSRIAELRIKRANLLGYATHAAFILEDNMAKNSENVYRFLQQLWKPAIARAKVEAENLQKLIEAEGLDFTLQPWDWWYYAEKLKKAEYELDDAELRPYFQLEKVREGAFMVANKLYGITFSERSDIPVYHPDVKVFEVKEADGTHIGILYTDYFPRSSKRGGAWMNAFRGQSKRADQMITPVISNVFNFTKPTADQPSLLSWEEVSTLFHEFGHALHGLLSNCRYEKLSGTSVPRDFVELPSQVMENWASDPVVVKMYARHYQTDEPIPDELIDKIKKSATFNQGFETVELLAAAFLDMDWHTLTQPIMVNAIDFENQSMSKIGLIPEIVVRYRSPNFRHIFSGGYSAGYYSYIWAEVLDADAFQAFKETDIFNQDLAKSLRENILARGGTEDPMALYVRFRGREPRIEPLLEKRGLN
jgi:peptidyl-dipeptidase Dcp